MRPLAKEGDRDRDNAGDEKEGAGKENHPNPVVSTVVSTRAASDGNRRVTKERSSKGKGEGGSGVKSFRASPVPSSASDAAVAAAATPAAGTSALNTVAGKQKKKTAAVRGGAREVEKSGKNKTSSRNRAAKKEVRKDAELHALHRMKGWWCRLPALRASVGGLSCVRVVLGRKGG